MLATANEKPLPITMLENANALPAEIERNVSASPREDRRDRPVRGPCAMPQTPSLLVTTTVSFLIVLNHRCPDALKLFEVEHL